MTHRKGSFWNSTVFQESQDEVNKENRLAIRMLAIAGLPLSVANILAQTIMNNRELSLRSCWLLIYFTLLALFEQKIMPSPCRRSTEIAYVIEAPVMVMSILMGTFWDPTHQALTFLLFLMAMPVFILDRPVRVMAVSFGWAALFLGICLLVKDPSTHRGDFFHTLEFYLASMAVTMVVLRVRMESLRNLERTRFHLEHDELTNARNRRSLARHLDRYQGRELMVLQCGLDRLTLYNDFFGHETGDEMLTLFVQILSDAFGEEDTYRLGGTGVLCVLQDAEEKTVLQKLEQCRRKLRGSTFHDRVISLTFAVGYVTGQATDNKRFQNMLHLADIYSHKARAQGNDQTIGFPYSDARLRSGIVESNVATYAKVHETNQLTGLPSMAFFVERSDNIIADLMDRQRCPGVAFVNLLNFRVYNDQYGYSQGDRLIRYAANVLRQALPKERLLCCINGTQFGALCYLEEAQEAVEQLNQALDRYGNSAVACCAGFAPYDGQSGALSLLDRAKLAHDSIRKENGMLCVYDEKLDEELHFRQYIINHVDEAVEQGWLKVYYHPIVRSVTGKICNEEALSRWVDPTYGYLPPNRFIPVLEENRLIYKLSLHVVRQVLADFRRKKELGVAIVPVSVNLSRHDFQQCDMVKEISALLDEAGCARGLLPIEITESAFVEDQEMLKREVRRFRENGFQVWMDDFGSEYSTLNLLQELDFDLIKIDMQFMRNFSEEGKNRIIISDIIDMARRMGITTLIEGVETKEHVRILRQMGCEKLQGFCFSRPMSLDDLLKIRVSDRNRMMEDAAQSSYFEAMGRVDLNRPFSRRERNSLQIETETPAGILELRDGELSMVMANPGLRLWLTELGLLVTEQEERIMDTLPLTHVPEAMHEAALCSVREEWQSFVVSGNAGEENTCYLRRISDNPVTGAVGLLIAVLRSVK